MHEWALAEAVVKTVEAAAKDKKIQEVRVLIGELQDIAEDVFSQALEELSKQRGYQFPYKLVEVPAEFTCRNCGHSWKLSEVKDRLPEEVRESIHFIPDVVHAFITCPKCGSPDFEVSKGRGVSLEIVSA